MNETARPGRFRSFDDGGGQSPKTWSPEFLRSRSMSDLGHGGVALPESAGMPDMIGSYRILGKLGSGAFGQVFLGEAKDGGGKVAIKELFPRKGAATVSEAQKANLLATFRRVQTLNNDHIADPVGVFSDNGRTFTVMRYAPGDSLKRWALLRGDGTGAVEPRLAFEICAQVADALDAAHARRGGVNGIMHLDIKPDNIQVEDAGDGRVHAQVLDFGLAREVRPGDDAPIAGIGTPDYMAPEVWKGATRPDGRADQYSLACVLYELLCGSPPFAAAFSAAARRLPGNLPRGQSEEAWMKAAEEVGRSVVCEVPAQPCGVLDKAQNNALLRALAKSPEDRFPSCVKMVEAVRRGGTGARAWLSLAAAVAVVVVGAVVFSAVRRLEAERNEGMSKVATIIEEKGGVSQIALLVEAADKGDAEAAFELGRRNMEGVGVDRDFAEALRRFEAAGNAGHAVAMFRAGDCHARGIGTVRDDAAAADWFRRGAEAGDADAAGAWAECLWDGRGTARDRARALDFAGWALGKGVASAQYVAGLALVEGVGPEHNPQRGAALLELAAKGGHANAQFALSRLYAQGKGVAKSETTAAKWSLKAANGGLADAMLDMSKRYAEGRGVAKSPSESRRWLGRAAKIDEAAARRTGQMLAAAEEERRRQADETDRTARARASDPLYDLKGRAEGGEPAAMFELAKRLDDGIGTGRDAAAAVRWWKALAEKRDVDAADERRREEAWGRYGVHLHDGVGVRKDVASAIPWLEKFANGVKSAEETSFSFFTDSTPKTGPSEPEWATDRKQVERGKACLLLAKCHDNGDGVQRSASKANHWYEQGAEAGNRECLVAFVRRIADGRVTVMATEKAVWYRRAADAGDANAKRLYDELLRGGGGKRRF